MNVKVCLKFLKKVIESLVVEIKSTKKLMIVSLLIFARSCSAHSIFGVIILSCGVDASLRFLVLSV